MRIILAVCFIFISLLVPIKAQAAIQYFGYYNVNGLYPWVDAKDHIPEIGAKGYSNIGVITVSVTDRLPQYLAEMRQHHMYAILGVTAKFEDSNREANWIAVKEAIKGNEDIVYGFYFDESAWRGIGANEFRAYTKRIRDDYPDKATMLIEGYPPIYYGNIPPGYLDYVTDFGFDFYSTVEDPSFENGWNRYLQLYSKFYPLTAGKKVWLVPDGYGSANNPTSNLALIVQRYYEFAIVHPEVVGMLVFRYDPGDNSTYYTVQDTMDPSSKFYNLDVVNTHANVGHAILANAPAYPVSNSPAKPGDLNGDKSIDLYDYNLLIKDYGASYNYYDFTKVVTNYGK